MTEFNECMYSEICRYCNPTTFFNCCLRKKLREKNFKYCNSDNCFNFQFCNLIISRNITIESIPSLNQIKSFDYTIKKPLINFNHPYIPKIDISSPRNRELEIKIIKKHNIKVIAVSLQKLISNYADQIIKENYLQDLHKKLNFDGDILLLTNIKDIFCQKLLNNIPQYLSDLAILNPNIITTFDANFYIDQPLFITAYQIYTIMKANELIKDCDFYQIGLVPPAISPFFETTLETMLKMNYKTIGIPMLEINKNRNFSLKNRIINILNKFRINYDFEFILISTSPSKNIYADSFTSLSWTIINKGRAYTSQKKNKKREEKLLKYLNLAKNQKFQKKLIKYIGEKNWDQVNDINV